MSSAPIWRARVVSSDWPAMTSKSAGLRSAESVIRCCRLSIGRSGSTSALMSYPPETSSGFAVRLLKLLLRIEKTIMTKMTSANIETVSPVRNRLLTAYATAGLSTALMPANRPRVADIALTRMSELYITTQTADATIQTPARMNIDTLPSSSPVMGSTNRVGNAHITSRMSPVSVYEIRLAFDSGYLKWISAQRMKVPEP